MANSWMILKMILWPNVSVRQEVVANHCNQNVLAYYVVFVKTYVLQKQWVKVFNKQWLFVYIDIILTHVEISGKRA